MRYKRQQRKYLIITVNSLAAGRCKWNITLVNFKLISVLDDWGISCEIILIWMSLSSTYHKSTLIPVMAWCRQATSHYLHHCWPRSKTPYGVIRPQWVKKESSNSNRANFWQNQFRSLLCSPSNYWKEPNHILMKRLWQGNFFSVTCSFGENIYR